MCKHGYFKRNDWFAEHSLCAGHCAGLARQATIALIPRTKSSVPYYRLYFTKEDTPVQGRQHSWWVNLSQYSEFLTTITQKFLCISQMERGSKMWAFLFLMQNDRKLFTVLASDSGRSNWVSLSWVDVYKPSLWAHSPPVRFPSAHIPSVLLALGSPAPGTELRVPYMFVECWINSRNKVI